MVLHILLRNGDSLHDVDRYMLLSLLTSLSTLIFFCWHESKPSFTELFELFHSIV
jgi:hypothetical protein